MFRPSTHVLSSNDRVIQAVRQVSLVVGASLFVALCGKVTLPLPFTPVPLTLQNGRNSA